MLALAPKFNEEVVFQNNGIEIRLKFYLDRMDQLRMAITAPLSVGVFRRKIKEPANRKAIGRRYLKKMGQGLKL